MTSEDADIWRRFTRTIKPLRRSLSHHQPLEKAFSDPRKSQPASLHDIDDPIETFSLNLSSPTQVSLSTAKTQSLKNAEPLIMGETPGLDRRAAARLQRGQWPIEATLDLHGYRRNAARNAVEAFIGRSAAQGRRCVRVVTGKGAAGDIRTGWRGQGVLRAQLADWLNGPSVRPLVLAYTQAQPRDGGGGAFYILLRRRR